MRPGRAKRRAARLRWCHEVSESWSDVKLGKINVAGWGALSLDLSSFFFDHGRTFHLYGRLILRKVPASGCTPGRSVVYYRKRRRRSKRMG